LLLKPLLEQVDLFIKHRHILLRLALMKAKMIGDEMRSVRNLF